MAKIFLRLDNAGFTDRHRYHTLRILDEVNAAGYPTRGADPRVRTPLEISKSLKRFNDQVAALIESGGFSDLPAVEHPTIHAPGVVQLVEGVWRGIFLAPRPDSDVLGLLFSREPHDPDELLGALRAVAPRKEPG